MPTPDGWDRHKDASSVIKKCDLCDRGAKRLLGYHEVVGRGGKVTSVPCVALQK